MADDQRKRGVSFSEADKKAAPPPMIPKSNADKFKVDKEKYQVKSVIGTGSYGSVCEAKSTITTHPIVAIKRVAHLFDDLIDCKRILREISILSKLDHCNVVKLLDVSCPATVASFDELYIIMEICDSDLKKLCRTDVTLSDMHINTLLCNLLQGLKYLHSAGIYHRDLKPANCLVNQDCTVKICDFGLSRCVGNQQQQNLQELPNTPREGAEADEPGRVVPHTQRLKKHLTGHVVTRWYRAPELILLQENYTQAIDMWSVGCIYAELLGMLENGPSLQDRGPLFPGSSCFPLSPDHKHKTDYKYHTRGKHDQLNMIFNLIGTPPDADMDALEREDAKKYIKCFAKREGDGIPSLRSRYKDSKVVTDNMCDLLTKMLAFNPKSRITVEEALGHEMLASLRDPSKEKKTDIHINIDFEKEPDLDEAALRKFFAREVQKYQKDFK